MKNILILLFTLLFSTTIWSQTFFRYLIINNGSGNANYVGIYANEEFGDENMYTCNKKYVMDGAKVCVSKFDPSGNSLSEIENYLGYAYSGNMEIARDMYVKNDSLLIFGSNPEHKPISFKYPLDLSSVTTNTIDVVGCPWRVKYHDNDMILMCYDGNYLTGNYFTKFIKLDYSLNVIDTLTFLNLDPWDFQILNDTIYFSARDTNSNFSIKKVVGDTVEDFLFFNSTEYLVTQFEVINNEHFVVINRYIDFSLLHVFDSNGTEILTDTIHGNFQTFLKLTSRDNTAYLSWGDSALHLKIIESNFNIEYHEILNPPDTSFSVSTNYSTPDNIYIYGKWITGPFQNPIIIKTDHEGSASPWVGIEDHSLMKREKFNFYPNPVEDIVTVEMSDTEPAELIIYDVKGRVVLKKSIQNSMSIDLSFLKSGMYFITDKINYQKLIKK